MKPFSEASHRVQIAHLRGLAREAAAAFGLADAHIRLINFGFNATYRVRHTSGDFALRLNVNSKRSVDQVRGEVFWTSRLRERTGGAYPEAVPTAGGEPIARIWSRLVGRELPAVLYRWVPGRLGSSVLTPTVARQMGAAMAQMHRQSADMAFPAGASRPLLRSFLDDLAWQFDGDREFEEARKWADAAFARLASRPAQAIHFDLHPHNVLVDGDRLTVIDFDDSVLGWPGIDAAQTMFYLRSYPEREPLEAAFFEGLESSIPALGLSTAEFEALVAGRALLLANDIVTAVTASLVEYAPKYVERTRRRLSRFLETGRFDPQVS